MQDAVGKLPPIGGGLIPDDKGDDEGEEDDDNDDVEDVEDTIGDD